MLTGSSVILIVVALARITDIYSSNAQSSCCSGRKGQLAWPQRPVFVRRHYCGMMTVLVKNSFHVKLPLSSASLHGATYFRWLCQHLAHIASRTLPYSNGIDSEGKVCTGFPDTLVNLLNWKVARQSCSSSFIFVLMRWTCSCSYKLCEKITLAGVSAFSLHTIYTEMLKRYIFFISDLMFFPPLLRRVVKSSVKVSGCCKCRCK